MSIFYLILRTRLYAIGHTVRNLQIDVTEQYKGGFFGYIGDVKVQNLTINGTGTSSTSSYIGAVAGYAVGDTTFQNVHVQNYTVNSPISYGVGGFVGQISGEIDDRVEFINCSLENSSVTGYANVGAFWGTSTGSKGTIGIYNCTVSGQVNAINVNGGICGGYGATAPVQIIGLDSSNLTLMVNGTESKNLVAYTTATNDTSKAGPENTAVQNPDGTWAGVSVNAVAVYKGTEYATLKEAVQAAEDAKDTDITIQLLNDTTVDGAISSMTNLTVVGIPKADGTKPVVRSDGTNGLFSQQNQNTALTLKNLTLEITENGNWYIYHSTGTLSVSNCSFVMGDGVTNAYNIIMGAGVATTVLNFTDNIVNVNARAALTDVGNGSKIAGNTIDLKGEHWQGKEGDRTSILSLTAVQGGAGVEIKGNTFLNANRGIAVDSFPEGSEPLEAKNLELKGNVFDQVRFAFELSPEKNGACGVYDINENWYRFDGKVGQPKVQNADEEGNKFGFGEGSAEYLPAAGGSQTKTTPYYIAMGSTASFDGDKTYTASTGDDVVTAVNAMKDGDTLTLDGNITLNSELTIDKEITVDGMDKLSVGANGKLVIKAGTYDVDVTRYLPDGYKMENGKVVKVESETTTPDDSTSDTTTDSPAPTATPAPTAIPAPTAAPTAQPAATATAAIPQTSDTLPVGLLGGMAATAAAAFAALFVLRKRKSED